LDVVDFGVDFDSADSGALAFGGLIFCAFCCGHITIELSIERLRFFTLVITSMISQCG
jgi:hypothetical protein